MPPKTLSARSLAVHAANNTKYPEFGNTWLKEKYPEFGGHAAKNAKYPKLFGTWPPNTPSSHGAASHRQNVFNARENAVENVTFKPQLHFPQHFNAKSNIKNEMRFF